ncbi:MAG: hypothetical protein ABIO70_34920 [Pseudomonadota bacterium]
MIHLDAERIAALLDGSLDPAEARALAGHLAEDCPTCGAAVEAGGLTLDTLLRLAEAAEATPVALEDEDRADLWRDIAAGLPEPAAVPRRTPWRRPLGAAVALLAVAAATLLFVLPNHGPGRIKGVHDGDPSPPEVSLRVVAGRAGADGFVLDHRVAAGEVLPRATTLLFELETDRIAARYLFVLDGEGRVTQLAPPPGAVPTVEPAGSRRVGQGEDWVALGLDDMQGPLVLVAAASVVPLDPGAEIIGPWQAREPRALVDYATLSVGLAP